MLKIPALRPRPFKCHIVAVILKTLLASAPFEISESGEQHSRGSVSVCMMIHKFPLSSVQRVAVLLHDKHNDKEKREEQMRHKQDLAEYQLFISSWT